MNAPAFSNATQNTNYASFDGIRGIAAIGVMTYHICLIPGQTLLVPHGYLAVDFFFCLSGFVIAQAYRDRLQGRMTLAMFAATRLIRLYPLFLLGQIAGLAVFLCYLGSGYPGYSWEKLAEATAAGILLLPIPVTLASVPPIFPLNGPSWSLFLELCVNAVYACVLFRLPRPAIMAILCASAVALVATASAFGNLNVGWTDYNYWGGLPRVLFSFTAGLLVYEFRPRLRPGNTLTVCILAGLIMVLATDTSFLWYDLSAVLLFPLVLLLAAATEPTGQVRRICHFLGLISYPIYILQVPSIYAAMYLFSQTDLGVEARNVLWIATAAFIVMAATAAAYLYDRPVRSLLGRKSIARQEQIVVKPFPAM